MGFWGVLSSCWQLWDVFVKVLKRERLEERQGAMWFEWQGQG